MIVDINCDMGESFGVYQIGDDEAVLPSVSSINVACGFHAGDPRVMARTVGEAAKQGVAVGAHPGFPDLAGFGRRNLTLTADEARSDVLYQIGALDAFTRAAGIPLQHVKPHGQLNNMAVTDRTLADAVIAGIRAFDPALIVISYGGELTRAAEEAGLPVAHEVYADRAYNPDGTLVSRRLPGAVIHDEEEVVRRAVQMVRTGRVRTIVGEEITLPVDTICVHGDTPGAAQLARALREGLEAAGIIVRPLRDIVAARHGYL
ncbi:MAG TPA: 5-oxoprolinase subunit PxpA [Chloroflexota bacterium]|nr:5-oxoprolinase subunit PxpA [Chloroflexota bacterium]